MDIVEKAIEITATIDARHQLVLDEPLPVVGPMRVRVIILLPDEIDINEKEGFEWQTLIPPLIS